jgi:hypothetical protein
MDKVVILHPKRILAVEKAGPKWYINVDYENSIQTSYNIYG